MKKRYLVLLIALTIIVTAAAIGYTVQNAASATSQSKLSTHEPNNDTDEAIVDISSAIEQTALGGTFMQNTISGAFAIRNIETGKDIRPYNADTANDNDIILYPHHKWKCLTWEFAHIDGVAYQLKNLYTGKTFEPASSTEDGVALWQQPINGESGQYWEFIEQEDESYLIRLLDTDLYITVSSSKTNSAIVLMPIQDSDAQKWTLIEQYPRF